MRSRYLNYLRLSFVFVFSGVVWAQADASAALREASGEWTAPVDVIAVDDVERQASWTEYRLRISDAARVPVYFPEIPPGLVSGQVIRVRGRYLSGQIVAESVDTVAPPAASVCSTSGEQRTAVLMLTSPGNPLPSWVDKAFLQAAVFGSSGWSLQGFWSEVSYGKTWVTGDIFGPFTVNDVNNIEQAVAAADPTVDLSSYTRLFLIVPSTTTPNWGTVGCASVKSPSHGTFTISFSTITPGGFDLENNRRDNTVFLLAHEGGHGLGMTHANALHFPGGPLGPSETPGSTEEYGDPFSTMGRSPGFGLVRLAGHYNAPHKALLGWLAGGDVQTVETSGTFLLRPIEIPSGVRALRIRRGTGGTSWIWLEYRQPIGSYDSNFKVANTPDIYTGALAHYEYAAPPGAPDLASWLIHFNPDLPRAGEITYSFTAPLGVGHTWADPFSDLTLRVNGATSQGLDISVAYASPNRPVISPGGVVNAASFAGEGVAPGEIVAIFGANLGPEAGISNSGYEAGTGRLPTTLGGVTVTFDGQAAPLFYVSRGQINAQVPYEAAASATTSVVVTGSGGSSPAFSVPVVAMHTGIFTSGNKAIITDTLTGTLIDSSHPGARNSYITVWGTGQGTVTPAVATGAPASSATLSRVANPQAWIGGKPAEVQFAGLTPGMVGLLQFNVKIPADAPAGDMVPLRLSISGVPAQAYLGDFLTTYLALPIQ